jgi:hypothetical protein
VDRLLRRSSICPLLAALQVFNLNIHVSVACIFIDSEDTCNGQHTLLPSMPSKHSPTLVITILLCSRLQMLRSTMAE